MTNTYVNDDDLVVEVTFDHGPRWFRRLVESLASICVRRPLGGHWRKRPNA